MKKWIISGTKFKQEKASLFLTNGFSALIGIIEVYRILGVATAAGAEAKAVTPRSGIKEFFDK